MIHKKMHCFERCQSTESMICDQGGSWNSFGNKKCKKVKRCFSRRASLCVPLPVDNKDCAPSQCIVIDIQDQQINQFDRFESSQHAGYFAGMTQGRTLDAFLQLWCSKHLCLLNQVVNDLYALRSCNVLRYFPRILPSVSSPILSRSYFSRRNSIFNLTLYREILLFPRLLAPSGKVNCTRNLENRK